MLTRRKATVVAQAQPVVRGGAVGANHGDQFFPRDAGRCSIESPPARDYTTGDPFCDSPADLAWFRDASAVVNAGAIDPDTGGTVSVTGGPPTATHPAG